MLSVKYGCMGIPHHEDKCAFSVLAQPVREGKHGCALTVWEH